MSDKRFFVGFVIWFFVSVAVVFVATSLVGWDSNWALIPFFGGVAISCVVLVWWMGKAGAWRP